MEELIDWLPKNLKDQELPTSVAHGDFRVDNCIFHPTDNRVIAVLDWELSTLGDPISDLRLVFQRVSCIIDETRSMSHSL